MFGGGAKYITKSQVKHSIVIITDFNTQGKLCNGQLADTNRVNNVFFLFFFIVNIKHQQNPSKNSQHLLQQSSRYTIIDMTVINALYFCFELRVLKMNEVE